MIAAIVAGLVCGLSAGLAPGPLLALVLRQSLSHGRREGLLVALSPLVTDLPIVIVTLFLVGRAMQLDAFFVGVSFVGAAYLLVLAVETARAPLPTAEVAGVAPRSLWAGALANALSPHPYLFWLTVGAPTTVTAYRDGGSIAAAGFIAGFYTLLIGSKAVLALVLGGSRGRVSPRVYRTIMAVLGVALAVFAVVLMMEGWSRLQAS